MIKVKRKAQVGTKRRARLNELVIEPLKVKLALMLESHDDE